MAGDERLRAEQELTGTPARGLTVATVGFFAGLTTIVFYGVAGPTFKESLSLSGALLGILLSSPHISKAVLRIPFGAWVDEAGGRKPFLVLLALTAFGIAGLVAVLALTYPENFDARLYPLLLLFGVFAGAGGATFSVGITQTSYWYPAERQGFALGAFAGAGNIGPGVMNYAMPVLVGVVGLTWAYSGWLVFVLLVTVVYALFAVDSYYFQLVARGVDEAEAKRIAATLGQDVFPTGSTWESLKRSSLNRRTWVLVFLYTVSFGGGFTALSAWYPTYWSLFQDMSLPMAGLLAAVFVVYGSLVRIPGGSLSDRFGGENVAIASFGVMVLGAAVITLSELFVPALVGMLVLGTGMGVANAAVFELVPKYVPEAVGGASGWISGIGGAGTLVILPVMGAFVDVYGQIGYARGFVVFVVLSAACAATAYWLKSTVSDAGAPAAEPPAH